MKIRHVAQYLVVVTGLSLVAVASAADTKKPSPMDEKAAMEAMQQAATPGAAHKKLEALAGNFTVKSKSWMDPSTPPEESSGSSERNWILGNRYLQENYQGIYAGQPFTAIGMQGYDNVTRRYVGTWVDSMSTSITTYSGAMTGNTIKFKGTMSEPTLGKAVPYTMSLSIADNDHHTLEMWGPGPDGKNMKWMELQYTRGK